MIKVLKVLFYISCAYRNSFSSRHLVNRWQRRERLRRRTLLFNYTTFSSKNQCIRVQTDINRHKLTFDYSTFRNYRLSTRLLAWTVRSREHSTPNSLLYYTDSFNSPQPDGKKGRAALHDSANMPGITEFLSFILTARAAFHLIPFNFISQPPARCPSCSWHSSSGNEPQLLLPAP